MRIERKNIIVDDELYPRNQMDWLTAYRYAEAMQAGAAFPPLVVGKRLGAFVLLDGRHRLEAYRRNKIGRIPCILSRVKPEDFLLEAIRLNAANGRPLTIQERIQSSARLKAAGFSMGQIAKALFMPITSLTRLTADRVVTAPRVKGGLALVRKAPVPASDGLTRNEDQKTLAAGSVLSILQQAVTVFENGWVNVTDEEVAEQVDRLARAIRLARHVGKTPKRKSA